MRGILAASVFTIVVLAFSSLDSVSGDETVSWKSDYVVGILNYDNESELPIEVTTFAKDSLKLEWDKPSLLSNEILVGYEIQRKNIESDFQTIIQNYSPKQTSFIDKNLNEGYYAYNVIPIIDTKKADLITMHGIDRKNNLFSIYIKGQELIAENTLMQNCAKCFDPEFDKIDNVFRYEFSETTKRQNSDFQEKISFEVVKAEDFFEYLFEIKNNH